MTPEQAADARRRKKDALERQLAALDEEDRYFARASQPPVSSQSRNHTYPSASRSDVISPPWPQTSMPTGSTDWRSTSSSTGQSRNHTAPSAFQPVPDPTPMSIGTAVASSISAPWQRADAVSSSTRPNEMYTPSPDLHQSQQSRMPNPFSASFINIPVPSKEQVNVYLVRTQGQPLGLQTGWTISSYAFDVYDLFVAVIRLGGTQAVSRRQWWPQLAEILKIPGVNSPQGRNIFESGRQLYTFFTTHLAPLEDMWEQTSGKAEDAGRTVDTHSHSHLSRVQRPVSAARSGEDDGLSHSWTRTYPPQPPAPGSSRNATSNTSGPSRHRQPSGTSGTVPLHVNPSDISTRRSTDTHQSSSNQDYAQQYPYATSMSNTVTSSQHVRSDTNTRGPAPAPSVSPVIHHPVPGSLSQPAGHLEQYASGNTSTDSTPNLAAAMLPTSATRSQPGRSAVANGSSASRNTTKTKSFTFPSLTNYNPPKFASFDHLVQTNALTLPKLPPNVHLDYYGTPSEIYAKRCFELRSVVKKIQSKEPARHISVDEMTFWQKLLAILRHNPEVIIPGQQPMSTENAPAAPTQSTSGNVHQSGTAIPVNGQGAEPVSKKKRGRPRKDADGDGEAGPSQPKKRGRRRRDRVLENDPPSEPAPSTARPAEITPDLHNMAIDPRLLVAEANLPSVHDPPTDVHLAVPDNETPDHNQAPPESQATERTMSDSQADQSKKARKPWTTRLNPDGTPVPRKPYTIKLNPDGTPVSERFRKRLSSGTSGRPLYDTPPPESTNVTAGRSQSQHHTIASTLQDYLGDTDALGESDHESAPSQLQAAIKRARDAQAELARLLEASRQAQESPSQPLSQSVSSQAPSKNPARVEAAREAALRRWDRVRQERVALGLSTSPLTGPRAQVSPAASSSTPRVAASTSPSVSLPTRPPASASSASQPAPAARGGFSVPGAARLAAHKRWSLHNGTDYAKGSGRQSTPADQAYINAIRTAVVQHPASASPRKVIRLSGSQPTPGNSSQNDTPTRRSPLTLAHERNGSARPRSSLPLFLTPAPHRVFARDVSPESDEEDIVDLAGPPDDLADNDYEDLDEIEEPVPRVTRGAARQARDTPAINTRSRPKARASLPSTLSSSSPSTRPNGGRRAARRMSDSEPSARSVLTRNALAREDPSVPRVTRASFVSIPRSTRSQAVVGSSQTNSRPRRSLPAFSSQPPPSSQGRSRLVPKVEVVLPARAPSVSPLKLHPGARPRPAGITTPRIVAKPKAKPQPQTKSKAKARPAPTSKTTSKAGPRIVRSIRYEPLVVLPINKRRRQELIDCGAYDIFKDDYSDEEETLDRGERAGLRKIALPRNSLGRTARPTAPEDIPNRFATRPGPAVLEPFKTVLDESTLLKRACAHECQWKGCDSVLASEWHLRRHFDLKRHAQQGSFRSGLYGDETLYRCHWVECEKPCFTSLADLEQHLKARHISRTLACPWSDCGLRFASISHLTRHAVKHHDSPDDVILPLADTNDRSTPPERPDQPLPTEVRADNLIMPAVQGSTYSSMYRREWCKLKVRKGSLAPPTPSLIPARRPHILEALGEDAVNDDLSDSESLYTLLDGGPVTEERLLDQSIGRNKRRLFPVVDIRVRRVADAGWYKDPSRTAALAGDAAAPIEIDDIPDAPVSRSSPQRRARFDISDDEQDDETRGSEAEVWAELEDEVADTAFTPAGFPPDFDLELLNETGPTDQDDVPDFDALMNETFSTPAAYLGVDMDDEEQNAGPEQGQQVDEPMDLDDLPIWDGQLETMPAGLLGPAAESGVQAQGEGVDEALPAVPQAETIEAMDGDLPGELDLKAAGVANDEDTMEAGPIVGDSALQTEAIDPNSLPVGTDEPHVETEAVVAAESESTVPDFAGLFGKSPVGPADRLEPATTAPSAALGLSIDGGLDPVRDTSDHVDKGVEGIQAEPAVDQTAPEDATNGNGDIPTGSLAKEVANVETPADDGKRDDQQPEPEQQEAVQSSGVTIVGQASSEPEHIGDPIEADGSEQVDTTITVTEAEAAEQSAAGAEVVIETEVSTVIAEDMEVHALDGAAS